jgi:hypothetical protein
MSISGISSGTSATPLTFQALRSQINQDFSTISSSLQSNNVAGAQQAYSDIVQLTQGGSSAAAGGTLGKDFANLGTALQSGTAGSAQTALSQFDTDAAAQAQTNGVEGHHHHHHGGGSAESTSTSSDTSASGTTDSSGTTSSTASSSGGSNFLGSLVQLGLSLLK